MGAVGEEVTIHDKNDEIGRKRNSIDIDWLKKIVKDKEISWKMIRDIANRKSILS